MDRRCVLTDRVWAYARAFPLKISHADTSDLGSSVCCQRPCCLETQTWHAPTLDALGIPAAALPKIVSCAEEFGVIVRGALAGVRITGCLGDQHAATLGQRCKEGEVGRCRLNR
jgi:hypothetical protein